MRRQTKNIPIGMMLDWLQALFALCAGIGLILDNYDIMSLPVISSNLSKITFLFVCGLVVSAFLERRYKLQQIEDAVLDKYGLGQRMHLLGVTQVYKDRDDIPKLTEYLGKAKSDVLIVGISLYSMIEQNRSWFDGKIASGCSFRFLLPRKLEDDGGKAIAHLADEGTVRNTFNDLQRTKGIIADLAQKTKLPRGKVKVELRVFDFIPTMGIIMLDARKPWGSIRIEFYPYAGPVDKRPALELQSGQQEDSLYNYVRSRYEDLWEKSETCDIYSSQTSKGKA
jgi:hypothetical protein